MVTHPLLHEFELAHPDNLHAQLVNTFEEALPMTDEQAIAAMSGLLTGIFQERIDEIAED